ncbi:MAG: tetratricopeptide repeat protein, partial [Desulfobacterales bacterium]|nr:tetratricopeptide repeat protein [Desulfobacterales bacterium]
MAIQKILHVSLQRVNDRVVERFHYENNSDDFTRCVLDPGDIGEIIRDAGIGCGALPRENYIRLGQRLHQWLDGPDSFLTRAIRKTSSDDVLVLAIETGGRLARLPWEILHDDQSFLVSPRRPLIVPVRWRYRKIISTEPARRPLRVLFMAAAPNGVKPGLDFEREEALIRDATRRRPLTLTVEESGNLEELKKRVDSYEPSWFDVFHLTGHADLNEDQGCFLTETKTGEAHSAGASEIVSAMGRPPLVFLSGCRTGEAGRAGGAPSLAEELLELGVNAVLSWGRPVLDSEAGEAAAHLYGALSRGTGLAIATAYTRRTLIEKNARDWHLLRLYVAGQMPRILVTPRNHRAVEPASRRRPLFLEEHNKIKALTRQGFVGRRRPLQRCIRALRGRGQKIGVIFHGMAGLGKSRLAARLCHRLGVGRRVVIHKGRIDEPDLLHRLARTFGAPLTCPPPGCRDSLKFNALELLRRMEKPLLLVLDDFEANFKVRENRMVFQRGGPPIISSSARSILSALIDAARVKADSPHLLLITSRFMLEEDMARFFIHEQLVGMPEGDVKKKVSRLENEEAGASVPNEIAAELRSRAISMADGNPRLLEWLFAVLAEKSLDARKTMKRMTEKVTEFRDGAGVEEPLKRQSPILLKILSRMMAFKLPVPGAAMRTILEDIPNLDRRIHQASALGLLEVTRDLAEPLYRAPRILRPILHSGPTENDEGLNRLAARILYKIWWRGVTLTTEEQELEIHRLALAGAEAGIAAEIADHLAVQWHGRSRFNEVVELCENTLRVIGDECRAFHNLGCAEQALGRIESAFTHYQMALESCPEKEKKEQASIMANLASVYLTLGRWRKALETYQESIRKLERVGDPRGKAAALHNMALIYVNQGQTVRACKQYQRALNIFERIGDEKGRAAALHQMAGIHAERGEITRAMSLYQQSLDIKESIGDEKGKAATLHGMAVIFANQGRVDRALDMHRRSLAICESIGDARGRAGALHQMAGIYAGNDQIEEAFRLYRQSMKIKRRIGDVKGKAESLHQIALFYATPHRVNDALSLHEEPPNKLERVGAVRDKAASLHNLALL